MKGVAIGVDVDISELEKVLIKDGKYVPVPYLFFDDFSHNQLRLFGHRHAIYQFPTIELLEFLKSEIGDLDDAIEIGAGNGCIGRNLGIRMVDNFQQEMPAYKEIYDMAMQPTIKYGEDVENISGNDAVVKYRPKVVLANWVTNRWEPGMDSGNMIGVKEEDLFSEGVEKYIHCGNSRTHSVKPILKTVPYVKHQFPFLVTRAIEPDNNCVYIFKP